jgi:hypothetical protein
MAQYTKEELITEGFAPSASRAKMSIPFKPCLACKPEQFKRLPAKLKEQYELVGSFYSLKK